MSRSASRLAITPGEPAGIGPELLVRLAQESRECAWMAVCDPDLLRRAAARLKLNLVLEENLENPSLAAGRLTVRPVPMAEIEVPGQLNLANAAYVVETLVVATDACLAGHSAGLVTGPVQKSVINESGMPFSGHTEFLCERAQVEDVVMLLVADDLRVALATTHLPLKDVPATLTQTLLHRRLSILLEELRSRFSIRTPRVLVSGLNPHAGESGHLGREEIEVIAPVCERLRSEGHLLTGPLPADTLFTPALLEGADAVMAMYHDQGLPVLKFLGFGRAVNVTLGLPFVRTSVDHGTALDLAGAGKADVGSFTAALALAEQLTTIA